MKFTVENFRSFHEKAQVEVAPITILLGENSSGKSSFLAGFRYIIQSISENTEGSFNREPFFLGSYDQIAHYRGGRAGRSTNFTLEISIGQDEAAEFMGRTARRFTPFFFGGKEPEITEGGIKLQFSNEQSQPTLSGVILRNRYVSLLMKRPDLPGFEIYTTGKAPERITISPTDPERLLIGIRTNLDRNSILPYYSAIQRWVYSKINEKPSKRGESVASAPASVVVKANFPINIFSARSMYASAPFRTKPERTYSPIEASSSAEGSHIPILLAQAKAFEKSKWTAVKSGLESFGKESGMFKSIDIKRLGNSNSDPFQLVISVSQDRSNIIDVGYGVSQILPLIVETMINDDAKFFVFQQPEIHLHPRAQAELGSYFAKFALSKKKYLLLETHSDYIIDRIRSDLIAAKMDLDKHMSVLFFERDKLDTKIYRIKYDERGNVVDAPDKYRNFFIKESMRVYK